MNDPLETKDYEGFEEWWQQLLKLALEAEHHLAGTPEQYREYFDDGDTPGEALDAEIESELMSGESE